MAERLISADSHVRMTHDQIKAFLPTNLHQAYDDASGDYDQRMKKGAGLANQEGAKMMAKMIAASNACFQRPGYWDPVERLKDMDADGVDVEVIYSEVSAFRYLQDVKGGVTETVQAFNNALHAFGSVDPKRLVVSYQVPVHDIDLAVKEVHRVAGELGAKSLQLPVFPTELGQKDYYDERYDPLFAAIQETGLPICFHIGLKTTLDELAERDPTPNKGIMTMQTAFMTAESFGMLIMGGVLEKFPDLKVVYVEPGIGWVAWYIEMADDQVLRQGYQYPAISELPSHYMRKNINLTFIDEKLGPQRMADIIPIENMMWSTDYPHPVTSFPRSVETVKELFDDFSDRDRELLVSGNAKRVWNLD